MKYSLEKVCHYKYLEKHLDSFWQKVVGKTLAKDFNGGIIAAHGDKCEQYKDLWNQNNIPFPHGVAIYFLTYKKDFLVDKKSRSQDWVVENYPKYKKFLEPIDLNDPEIMSRF